MSSEDASEYLNEMAQGNPQNVNEFRLMTSSLEKVLNKIQSKKQSRKLGRYSMSTSYRIQPSTRQCETADRLLGGGRTKKKKGDSTMKQPLEKDKEFENLRDISIPMFTAKGMTLKRSTGEVITPYYFAYEDLREDWIKMATEAKKDGLGAVPDTPTVVVKDFTDVMCLSEGITNSMVHSSSAKKNVASPAVTNGDASTRKEKTADNENRDILTNPGFVPPKREIELIRRFYRNKSGFKDEFSSSTLH
jgi:hypothetical protein